MANRPKITEAQLAYAQRCERILRKTQGKVGRAAVAHRLGITVSCLAKHLAGKTLTLEQWEVDRNIRWTPTRSRQYPIGYNKELFNAVLR